VSGMSHSFPRQVAKAKEARESPRDRCVVLVGGTAWEGMASSERHLARALARRIRVVWIDPPTSVLRAGRLPDFFQPGRRLLRDASGVEVLRPVLVPGITRPVLREVAEAQRRAAIRSVLRRARLDPLAIAVGGLEDLFAAAPGAVRVLYGTDDFVAGSTLMGLDPAWVESRERRALAAADIVLAVSPALVARWTERGSCPVLFPNGTDLEAMAKTDVAEPASDVGLPRPIAGVVGHISARMDIKFLEAVADRGVSVLLVGPVSRSGPPEGLEALVARPNVASIGFRPFEQLPSYYRKMDVAMTPYADSAFNRASFPLKTLEYLAAGLPVVSTYLPSNALIEAGVIDQAATPEQFGDLVLLAAQRPRDEVAIAKRRRVAAEHTWEARAEQFLKIVESRYSGIS
jgi:teichuronic acid biosynthesis glycosyltransferase TuaH